MFEKPILPGWLGWLREWADQFSGVITDSDSQEIDGSLTQELIGETPTISRNSWQPKPNDILLNLSTHSFQNTVDCIVHQARDLFAAEPHSQAQEISVVSLRSDELEILGDSINPIASKGFTHLPPRLIPNPPNASEEADKRSPLYLIETPHPLSNFFKLLPEEHKQLIDRENYDINSELNLYQSVSNASHVFAYSCFPDTQNFLSLLSSHYGVSIRFPHNINASFFRYLRSCINWPLDMATTIEKPDAPMKTLQKSASNIPAATDQISFAFPGDPESIYAPSQPKTQKWPIQKGETPKQRHFLSKPENQSKLGEALSQLSDNAIDYQLPLNWAIDELIIRQDTLSFIETYKVYANRIREFQRKLETRLVWFKKTHLSPEIKYLVTQKRLILFSAEEDFPNYQKLYKSPEAEAFDQSVEISGFIIYHLLYHDLGILSANPKQTSDKEDHFQYSWKMIEKLKDQHPVPAEILLYDILLTLRLRSTKEANDLRDTHPEFTLNLALAYILALTLKGEKAEALRRLKQLKIDDSSSIDRYEHWLLQHFTYSILLNSPEEAEKSLSILTSKHADYLRSDRDWSPGFLSKRSLLSIIWKHSKLGYKLSNEPVLNPPNLHVYRQICDLPGLNTECLRPLQDGLATLLNKNNGSSS